MTDEPRVPSRWMACAIALAGFATLLALPTAVLAGQVTNKAHQTFQTLSAAVAAAQFNDTLTVTGNVQEPGPVSLAGFTGTIRGLGQRASVSQAAPGTCGGSAFNCVFDASGAGSVTITKLAINVPGGAVGVLAAAHGGLSVSNPLSVIQCTLTGSKPFFGIVLAGASGGPFTLQQNTIRGSIRNGIVVLGNTVTRLFVNAKNNQIVNTDPNADFVGIIVAFSPPTPSTTVAIFNNTIDGGGSVRAVAGIDVVFTDRALVKVNTVQNVLGGTPDFDQAPGSGIRLRQATNLLAHGNLLAKNTIGIQIDPDPGEVSNNVTLEDNRLQSTVTGAIGLIFNPLGQPASAYTGPVDARDNQWAPGDNGQGPNSLDGTCACGPAPDPAALSIVNGTPSTPTCNNTPSASGGDILSCPAAAD